MSLALGLGIGGLAGYLGVDVRILGLFHPDKWIPYFAGRYYWSEVLDAGVKPNSTTWRARWTMG